MNAILSLIERFLIGAFLLALGVLIVTALVRYKISSSPDQDSWVQIKSKNSIEAYLEYLRECHSCPHEADAEEALDALQRPQGLVTRLSPVNLPPRTSIALPIFSPDGKTLLATAGGTHLNFWDANTGKHLLHSEKAFVSQDQYFLESLSYSSDGKQIAAGMSGTMGGHLTVWDEKKGERLADYAFEGYDIKAVAFVPKKALVAWMANGPVGLWEPSTGRLMRATHEGVSSLAFLQGERNSLSLLSAAGREVWFWNPKSMEVLKKMALKTEKSLLGLSHDGTLIFFHEGPVVEVWNTLTGKLVATLLGHGEDITAFCLEPKKRRIVLGSRSGGLSLWDISLAKEMGNIIAHRGAVEQLACSIHGKAASIGWESAKIWDLEKLSVWNSKTASTE